jgi:hypothetical protein
VYDLNKIPVSYSGYTFENKTTIEAVDNNDVFIIEINPITKKVIHLNIHL